MEPETRVVVLIPAWNEEQSVGDVVKQVQVAVPACDVLVIDDGSSDGTARVARSAGARVASLPYNLGVGGAMRTGYRYAFRHGYDVAVQVDADGQHDPNEILDLLARLSDADVVIGARFAGKGAYHAGRPRRWAMRLLAWQLSRMAGTSLTDVTSGFRAVNRRAIALFAQHYPTEYLGDTVESLVVALRAGYSVRQVPVEMRPRSAGAPSHSPGKAAVYLFRAVLALVIALVRKRPHPPESEV